MRKKFTAFTALIISLLMIVNTAFAAVIFDADFSDGLSDEWSVSKTGGGNPSAQTDNGVLKLSFDETDTASTKRVQLTSPQMQFDTDEYCISLNTSVGGINSSLLRTLYILDGTSRKELLSISESIKLFGKYTYEATAENKEYKFDIYINEKTKKAYVWIDGECVYVQELSELNWPVFAKSRQLRFENRGTNTVESSLWEIKSLNVQTVDSDFEMSVKPDNGAKMVKLADLQDGIEIDCGGYAAPSSYGIQNYELYLDEQQIPFSITQSNGKIYINPDDGFVYDGAYKLIIKEIKKLDNEILAENKEISFTTEIENYKFPVISTDKDEYELYVGETLRIITDIETEQNIGFVTFSVNGKELKTFENPTEKRVVFEAALDEGEYLIDITAADEKGGAADKKQVSVKVYRNNPPIVEFELSGKTLTKANGDKIRINAYDDDGSISKIELYADGALIGTADGAPCEFEISQLNAGKVKLTAIAYDDRGAKGEAVETVTVILNKSVTVAADNLTFETYSGDNNTFPTIMGFGGSFDGNTAGFIKGGYVNAEEENGGSHGRSLILGMSEENSKSIWMSFPSNGSVYGVMDLEFNFYIEHKINNFRFMLRGDSNSTDVFFNKSGIVLKKGGADAAIIPYEEKTWYRIRYVMDINTKKYSFYFKNADSDEYTCYADNWNMSVSNIQRMDSCRLIVATPDAYTFIGIDNVTSKVTGDYPYITSVGYGKDDNIGNVDASTDRINIHLSSALKADSVTADKVKLSCDGYDADVSKISYENNTVTLMLNRPLISNEEYTVTLSDKIQILNGSSLGEELVYKFNTLPKVFDVYNGGFSRNGGNITYTADLINSDGTKKTAWVIMTVYDGIKIKSVTVKKYECINGAAAEVSAPYAEGNSVSAAIWDGLLKPSFIANKIYKY